MRSILVSVILVSLVGCGGSSAEGTPGPQGEQGPRGLPGLDGKNGAPGKDGAPGLPGTSGTNGAPGAAGRDGINGTNGAPGAMGAPGPVGPKGPAGHWAQVTGKNGSDLGLLIPTDYGMGILTYGAPGLPDNQILVFVPLIFYEGAGCTGKTMMPANLAPESQTTLHGYLFGGFGATLYVGNSGVKQIAVNSYFNGSCVNAGGQSQLGVELVDSGMTLDISATRPWALKVQ